MLWLKSPKHDMEAQRCNKIKHILGLQLNPGVSTGSYRFYKNKTQKKSTINGFCDFHGSFSLGNHMVMSHSVRQKLMIENQTFMLDATSLQSETNLLKC